MTSIQCIPALRLSSAAVTPATTAASPRFGHDQSEGRPTSSPKASSRLVHIPLLAGLGAGLAGLTALFTAPLAALCSLKGCLGCLAVAAIAGVLGMGAMVMGAVRALR